MQMVNARPHILMLCADQWRGDVLGHTGNASAQTPNIDRLVDTDALSFSHAFCQNPECTPSQYSYLTGRYPHQGGPGAARHEGLSSATCPNMMKVLREAGYSAWCAGRSPLSNRPAVTDDCCDVMYVPQDQPFSKWATDRNDAWRGSPGSDSYYSLYRGEMPHSAGRMYFYDEDWANVLGAVQFIHEYASSRPFCMYLRLMCPHPPYAADEPWFSMTNRAGLPPRIQPPQGFEGKACMLRGLAELQNLQGWSENRWADLRACYYGMCARADHQVGLIVDALKDAGIYDTTMVLVFGAHGDFAGDYGLVETTQNTFEDVLTRVPLVMKPPADLHVQAGVCDALVELVDIPATLYDLTGIEPGYRHSGRSLLPAAKDECDNHRDAVFSEGGRMAWEPSRDIPVPGPGPADPTDRIWPRKGLQARTDTPFNCRAAMCRTKEFKYVRRLGESDELYDLEKDPGEVKNVIEEKHYSRSLGKMRDMLMNWYMSTCETVAGDMEEQ